MIKKIDESDSAYAVGTYGLGETRYGNEAMCFHPYASCGDLEDGVGFDLGKGAWCISMKDLEEMVRISKEIRKHIND